MPDCHLEKAKTRRLHEKPWILANQFIHTIRWPLAGETLVCEVKLVDVT
jgi:hypothetical protein